MKIRITQNKIEYWAILWIILFSGSLYFNILRIRIVMLIVGVTILFIIFRYKSIDKKNFEITLLWMSLSIISSVINRQYGFDINEIILFAEKMLFVCVVASITSFNNYKKKFVIIMTIEAVLSIICFLYVDVLAIGSLPLQQHVSITANGYYLTPYYTVGWENSPLLHRNAGIFSEPGAHQICLNYALLYLLSDSKKMGFSNKKYYFSVVSLAIAVFTTISTTGYMCLVIVILSSIFAKNEATTNKSEKVKRNINKVKVFSSIIMIILCVIENKYHIIEYKLSGGGSYTTRVGETSIGYKIAFTRPLLGYGMFNSSNILRKYNILYMSNGFASFLIGSGLIIGSIFVVMYFIKIGRVMNYGILFQICAFAVFLICTNSSSGVLNPVNIVFIMNWMNSSKFRKDEYEIVVQKNN